MGIGDPESLDGAVEREHVGEVAVVEPESGGRDEDGPVGGVEGGGEEGEEEEDEGEEGGGGGGELHYYYYFYFLHGRGGMWRKGGMEFTYYQMSWRCMFREI